MDNADKEQAFLQMVERNKGRMVKICRSYVDDFDQLDDLMQDAILNLWKGYESFRNESDESTWVYRVTLNCCLDTGRRRQHSVTTVPLVNIDIQQEESTADERSAALHALIARLDPHDRALTLLRLESLSYQEIADILGMTPKNVSVRLTRIRQKLRTLPDLHTLLDL